jgi:hypothetical protein
MKINIFFCFFARSTDLLKIDIFMVDFVSQGLGALIISNSKKS